MGDMSFRTGYRVGLALFALVTAACGDQILENKEYSGLLNYPGEKVVIPAGVTVLVKPYGEGDDLTAGQLAIIAREIIVAGTIDAVGAGYGGGGGGAGAHGCYVCGSGGSTGQGGVDGERGGNASDRLGGNGGQAGGYGGGGGGTGGAWRDSGAVGGTGSVGGGNGGRGANVVPFQGGGGGGGSGDGEQAADGGVVAGGAGVAGGGGGGAGAANSAHGADGGGGGGGGAGPFGGKGGDGGERSHVEGYAGTPGGYLAQGANGDSSTDMSVVMGSGGGGGGGGNESDQAPSGGPGGVEGGLGTKAWCVGGGGGGGGGAAGGGAIILKATTSIEISGQLKADGGGKAELKGGYGAGGGILLAAPTVTIEGKGSISSLGGNMTGAGTTSNGGTLKIFATTINGDAGVEREVGHLCKGRYRCTGTIRVRVADWRGTPMSKVRIEVWYRGLFPMLVDYTNPQGYYEIEQPGFLDSLIGGQYNTIVARLANDIVEVRENYPLGLILAKTKTIGSDDSSCEVEFEFGSEGKEQTGPAALERVGVWAFEEIQKANSRVFDLYNYRATSRAIVAAQDHYWTPNNRHAEMSPLSGTIYLDSWEQTLPENSMKTDIWHEYGHFVHRLRVGPAYFLVMSTAFKAVCEGWATYFGKYIGCPDLRNDDDHLYDSRDVYELADTYASIFNDIADGSRNASDDDLIVGHDTGYPDDGQKIVWKVLMRGTVVGGPAWTFTGFFIEFGLMYPKLSIPLYVIYASHKIPGYSLPTSASKSGTIVDGQTLVAEGTLDSTVAPAKFQLRWPGSDLDLTLTTPRGVTIDPAYAEQDPNVTYVEAATEECYTIERPEPGRWQMHVTAVDVPPEGESYTVSMDLTTNLILILSTDKEAYGLNEPIALKAELLYDANSYPGSSVETQVQTPGGTETLTLFDDGLHNDGNDADGVYGNTFMNTAVEGEYVVTATATGLNPFGEPFVRQTSRTVLVQNLPDLEPVDLTGVSGPGRGQMTLTTHVRNNGTKDAGEITVAFYDTNDVNTPQIGEDIVIEHLGPGQVKEVSTIWDASEGLHNVVAVVDYNNVIAEGDETNNALSAEFKIAAMPVAQWAFDEASGTKASDSAGSSPGTVYGAKWVQGRIGQALRFDGWDDYVDCGKAAVLAPEKTTIALWIYAEGKAAFQYPLGKAADLAPSKDYTLMTSSEGKLEFAFGESGFQQVAVRAGTALPVGQWVHVAATRDGSTASLYIDGQLAGSAAYSFSVTNKGQPLRIGSIGSPDPVGFFKGKIDDVRIYDKALSLEEVQELYSQP